MFALNNSDCINIFNVADELNRKFVIQEKLINEVSRRIEQTGAVLDADEIWSFIDDFHCWICTWRSYNYWSFSDSCRRP